MKKRIISLCITMLMLVSIFAAFSLPASAASMVFTVKPVVLIGGGNEYNIVWENNNVGIGYVTYKYDGKSYTVYDEENGVVRSDDRTHTVRIPAEHLDKAGGYTVHASTVAERDGYSISVSDTATETRTFKGYTGQKKITIGCISDTHLIYKSKNASKYAKMLPALETAVNNHLKRPDIVLLNGDITNELIHEEEYYALFELIRIAGSDGTYPVLYTVGNHEKRGFYSKEIEKYLCFDTGEFYTHFDYGSASIYVVDIGEDKEDDNKSYTNGTDPIGVIDMERYFEEQLKYFENHPGYTNGATYTFTVGHGPGYVGHSHYAANQGAFASVFKNYGTHLHLAGHIHRMQFNEKTGVVSYPVIYHASEANGESARSMLMTMENGTYTCKGMDSSGATLWTNTVSAEENGSSAPKAEEHVKNEEPVVETVVEDVETTPVTIPTMAGLSTTAIKGAADTTANVTKPVVFDAGEYYSIVWQTTSGIKAAGYVDVSGVTKTFMDQHGGKLRTETTHSVRIPKETLSSGRGYTIKSRVVTNYNGYGANSSIDSLTFGAYAAGTQVKFNAQPNGKTSKFTILAVANKTGGSADAQKLLAKYKTAPNLVVMTGDMTKGLNTEQDFGALLEYANTLTGGKTPVMLLRGENETKGAFAAYLPRILHHFTSTENINRLYTTYSVSNLAVIGLDTATTKPDSDKSYHGFASFDKLRKEQATWLESELPKSFAGDYNIVFANATNLKDCVGVDIAKGFEKHNVHLVVSAGNSTQFADGGSYYSQATIGDALGLLITCKDDEISVQSIGDEMTELGKVIPSEVTYTGEQTTPPIDSGNNENGDDGENDNGGSTSTDDDDDDNNNSNNNGASDDDDDDDNKGESNGNGSYIPGESGGFDGSVFVDDVEDGWYYDYLGYNVTISDSDITLSGEVTEGKFIHAVARYAGVANATSEDNAAQWANDVGLFNGTLGDNTISQDTANSIVKSIFEN